MTVEALTQFMLSQGPSQAVVSLEWDSIWTLNKKIIDPIAPRFWAICKENRQVHFLSLLLVVHFSLIFQKCMRYPHQWTSNFRSTDPSKAQEESGSWTKDDRLFQQNYH